jgi:hypothetical protein
MVITEEQGMASGSNVSIDLDMAFPTAGVGFAIQVRLANEAEGAALQVRLRAVAEGKTAMFTRECSYPLGDFIGGFCRWLGTKGVTVSHTDQEVSGHFHPRYTVPQMLSTTQELCQLLEDKFGAYPHSILGG